MSESAPIVTETEAPGAVPASMENELDSLKDRHLRLQADYENFRKRKIKEAEESRRYALQGIMEDLLPILDHFELALAAAVLAASAEVEALVGGGRYDEALSRLATLREPVDAFFEGVMVLAEDPRIRARRLALLGALQALFHSIADFSRLPGAAG